MSRTKLKLIVSLIILSLSLVAADLTLDQALNYSLSDKKCTDTQLVKIDKTSIENHLKQYQTSSVIKNQIDLLKRVRQLIKQAKESIIRVDSFASFAETKSFAELQKQGFNEILEMISVMQSSDDKVDKLQLCDKIIQKIDELVAFNESVLNRSGYDNYPTVLQSKIDQINTFLKRCEDELNGLGAGSIKWDKIAGYGEGSIKQEKLTDINGSLDVDNGNGNITPNPNPNPTPVDNNGSLDINNGNAVPNPNPNPNPQPSVDNNGSLDINNGSGGSVTPNPNPNPTPTVDNNGSLDINNGSGGSVTPNPNPNPTPTVDNNGSLNVDNGSGGNVTPNPNPNPTPSVDNNGSLDINNGSGVPIPNPTPSTNDSSGSIKVEQGSTGSISITPQYNSVSTGTAFIQKKIKSQRKKSKHQKTIEV